MASTFSRKLSRNGGTSLTAVGSYTVPASTTTVVIGLSVSNTTGNQIKVSATLNDGVNDYYLIKDAPVQSGSTLIVIGAEQKIALVTGDSVKVVSDTVTSIDSVMSILENT